MKISQIKIKNFRGYRTETVININDLTVFVGKNDVGKSTILEALDIFFNEGKGAVKLDKDDINKTALSDEDKNIVISIVFDDLPTAVIIDAQNETSLENEYLLNSDGKLEVIKEFPNAGKEKVFINAYHPTNPDCADLLLKKLTDLRAIVREHDLECDQTKNAEMRAAIWQKYEDDLQLQEIPIDVSKVDEKNTWEKLKGYMPIYALFQSDRKNSDGDDEIQDPMKLAVKAILKDNTIKTDLENISIKVNQYLQQVADETLEKLNEMNPEIATSLIPVIPSQDSLKWADVFKSVTISGDEGIPINKRGSGVKRLVLLNFFRAEAERRKADKNAPDIIYAIEEPETSQHPDHQRKLINAFIELSKMLHTQIILTTHSPAIVKMLKFENLKLIKDQENSKAVISIEQKSLPYPSLNEVNFLAFGESDESYYNELYGFIEDEGRLLGQFKQGKGTRPYIRDDGDGQPEQKILSEYIRHKIHHPGNRLNDDYTPEELQQSIRLLRDFIREHTAT